MQVVRWVLLLPFAVLLGMLGSLGGGIVASVFGQAAVDTSGAFFGTLAFVCAAGAIAPSHRGKVTLGAASLVAILACLSFALAVFTRLEPLADLSTREKVLTPVAQLLGGLYGLAVLPSLLTEGSTLDRLWRELVTLGTLVGVFGALVAVIGFVTGLLTGVWIGLAIGGGVLLLGVLTLLFPFVHLSLRVSRAEVLIERQIQQRSASDEENP
jgi:hypothetical protein